MRLQIQWLDSKITYSEIFGNNFIQNPTRDGEIAFLDSAERGSGRV
jgi:hypothetical protein